MSHISPLFDPFSNYRRTWTCTLYRNKQTKLLHLSRYVVSVMSQSIFQHGWHGNKNKLHARCKLDVFRSRGNNVRTQICHLTVQSQLNQGVQRFICSVEMRETQRNVIKQSDCKAESERERRYFRKMSSKYLSVQRCTQRSNQAQALVFSFYLNYPSLAAFLWIIGPKTKLVRS